MKTFPLFATCWLFTLASLWAQTIKLPPNPNDVTRRRIGGGGISGEAAVNVSPGPAAAAQTIVVQYVAVTAMRQWTNAEGKTMTARLLAFAAPVEGETGPVEVIRDGQVRFLMESGKKPVDYPLTHLSQSDQIDIKAIAQAARRGAPAKAPKGTAPAGPVAPKAP